MDPTLTLLQIIVLAIVQGVTEFLPISSSGHLVIVPKLTDWPDQGLMMDVGVHVGTLMAVIFYFRKDVTRLFIAFINFITFRNKYDKCDRHLMLALIISTIPIVIFGALASKFNLTDVWRTIEIIGWTSITFGLLLYWFDTKSGSQNNLSKLSFKNAAIIGFAQVFAIIPGTSRSGVTMTAARALGFNRIDAARFSMLMSIPTIMAAALLQLKELFEVNNLTLGSDLILGMTISFIAALITIKGLLRWLEHASMTPFVIYRIALGVALLIMVYS
jgi:undecaprenyl-diphosphatase